jgi:hypothetical protein
MAMTPYPAGDNTKENPSILVSNDRETWMEPAGINNPISPYPAEGYQADTCLIFEDGVLYCFYHHQINPNVAVEYRTSSNGIEWSEPTTAVTDINYSLLSQSIIKRNGIFEMYYINSDYHPHRLERRTAEMLDGAWSAAEVLNLDPPIPLDNLWHIDVVEDAGLLWMLVNTEAQSRLFLAVSGDGGVNWSIGLTPVIPNPPENAWDALLYRGSVIKTDTGFDCWYSARVGEPPVWRVGFTTIVIPD